MFGRKKREDKGSEPTDAVVKILGTGCKNCDMLETNVKKALVESGLKDEVAHVTEIDKIVSYGVMQTPSLVFGNEVVSVGRVLNVDDVKKLIEKHKEMFG